MADDFEPRKHVAPIGIINTLSFYLRLMLDFQVLTVYRDLKKNSSSMSGNILDIGCGSSPYKHLFNKNKEAKYFGLDTIDASNFRYNNDEITYYDGKIFPFESDFFDSFICTEVMEHVFDYETFANEIHRVLKKDGVGILTVPWSARFHYAPHDYFRYTPSALKNIFSNFSEIVIVNRGTDITVVAAKAILIFVRNIFSKNYLKTLLLLPFLICIAPMIFLLIILGHISVLFKLGSSDDPLGYSVILKK